MTLVMPNFSKKLIILVHLADMKRWFLIVILGLQAACANHKTQQPNIILFLVDDMGWTDTSVQFYDRLLENNKFFKTPNMEILASQGMIFSNAYASSPVCSPTRVSIMTGMNPARTKITNWIPGEGSNENSVFQRHELPNWKQAGLVNSPSLLPVALKQVGYKTIHIGKAHFGEKGKEGADPSNLGFQVNIGGSHSGHPASYYPPYGEPDHSHKVSGLSGQAEQNLYLNDALTQAALQQIEIAAKSEEPFFMNMAHYALHTPIQGDTSLIENYIRPDKNRAQQHYATMVESMDNSLGSIMVKLKELGIDQSTIIIFASDNGGLATHAGPPTTNYPLNSGKGTSREGGVRVPFIVKWPNSVMPGTSSAEPVISHDIYPTVLKMAGVPVSLDSLDGWDLTKTLQGAQKSRQRPLYWHYPHYWAGAGLRNKFPEIMPFSAIRNGDYKLIYSYDSEIVELYNIKKDIGETNNLALTRPEVAEQLCNELSQYLISVDAQTPVNRNSGQPVALPHISK